MRPRIAALLLLATLAAATLSACTMWGEPRNKNWKNITGLEDHERLLWKAAAEQDWVTIEARMASNYRMQEGGAVLDKAQLMEKLRRVRITSYSLTDFDVVAHGETVVVSYTASIQGTNEEGPFGPFTRLRLSVWQKQNSGWVLVAQSDSPAK